MPVHVHLLVESGIHIIECLNLEQLAADGRYDFSIRRLAAEDPRWHWFAHPSIGVGGIEKKPWRRRSCRLCFFSQKHTGGKTACATKCSCVHT